eukprot:Sdes_comp20506_c0_seq15m15003
MGGGDKDSEPTKLEEQFILRLPADVASKLRGKIQDGTLGDSLQLQFEPNMRYGKVSIDSEELFAKLVDLPCIIESHKTLDNKNFYKTADICQLLICQKVDDEVLLNKRKEVADENYERAFVYNHGITPPMKNVRTRRFRKQDIRKNLEGIHVLNEVERLLKEDQYAVEVVHELLEASKDSREGQTDSPADINSDPDSELTLTRYQSFEDLSSVQTPGTPFEADMSQNGEELMDYENLMENATLSSSNDQKEIEGYETVLTEEQIKQQQRDILGSDIDSSSSDDESEDENEYGPEFAALQSQLVVAHNELELFASRIHKKEAEISSANNPALKVPFLPQHNTSN